MREIILGFFGAFCFMAIAINILILLSLFRIHRDSHEAWAKKALDNNNNT